MGNRNLKTITKIRFRFDDSSKTYLTFDRKIWSMDIAKEEYGIVKHTIWRLTVKHKEYYKIKNLIKVLYFCDFEKEVILERDGYSIFVRRIAL